MHENKEQSPSLKSLPPSVWIWVNNWYLSSFQWSKCNLTRKQGIARYRTRRSALHPITPAKLSPPLSRYTVVISRYGGGKEWKSAAASVCCVSLLWSALLLHSSLSHFKQLLLPQTCICPLLFCIIHSQFILLHFVQVYCPSLVRLGPVTYI